MGSYAIIPSNATGGSFTPANYTISYANGALTVTPAPLTVTANNATRSYDGTAYSGGNGIAYSGFVNGESASALGGTLAYGGTSQGAVNVGNYSIVPSGLASANYAIAYVNGSLAIQAAMLPPHSGIISPEIGKTTPDMGDARTLLAMLLGQRTPSATELAAADVSPLGLDGKPQGDGKLDFADLISLMRRINGALIW